MRTGLPAVHLRETPSTIRDDRFTRCSFPAATTHAPLWLWQEVQALPWSTEIVALTCGTQIACDPRRPYSSVHGKLVVQHRSKTKNVGTLPPLSSLNLLTIREWRVPFFCRLERQV